LRTSSGDQQVGIKPPSRSQQRLSTVARKLLNPLLQSMLAGYPPRAPSKSIYNRGGNQSAAQGHSKNIVKEQRS